ncbi:AI-2E family transporter [uncultured Paracoccus sp.]|uniref:AI-2E family transporter n=1 Tax=uncultured Paracoccus sp. TaxID=189685 RepID=UPI0026206203|nr:AI-2E family transporter [uncultured Paracoccus sp.]
MHDVPPGETSSKADRPTLYLTLMTIVAVVLSGWALHALATVFVPLLTAILLALAVIPVRDWIRKRVSRRFQWLGIVAAMALILLILAGFVAGVWIAAQQVTERVPSLGRQLVGELQDGGQQGSVPEQTTAEPGDLLDMATDALVAGDAPTGEDRTSRPDAATASAPPGGNDPVRGAAESIGSADQSPAPFLRMVGERSLRLAGGLAEAILSSFLSLVAGVALILFLTLLLLIESGEWRGKIRTIMQPRNEWRLTESADVIAGKVRDYLGMRAVVGAATALLYALWLWLFGVDLVLVWALLTFLLNFVPTIGSLIAGLLPVAYAMITQSWGSALAVGAGLLVIEQVMGNYFDPRLLGRSIALSPLVILVSLVFWGWVWGIAGTLLAVPVTVAMVVLGAHVPVLRPYALLLTDRTSMRGLDEATRAK